MRKRSEKSASFAQMGVILASDALVLLSPETMRNRDRTNLKAKYLSDYCHIYIIARRSGIAFVPESVKTGASKITGTVRINKNGLSTYSTFFIGCDTYSGKWIVDGFPHKRLWLSSPNAHGSYYIPSYIVPSIGFVKDERAHQMEVLYVGQSFGEGDRTALDRLQSHKTLQTILADALYQTPDQDILLLLVEYAPPKLQLIIKPERPDEAEGFDDAFEIKRRMDQLEHTMLTKKNRVTMVEAALIRYFKPPYNEKFVDADPNEGHRHLEECYEADFSALIVEINTEDAQVALFSRAVPAGLHHLIRFDLHDPKVRGSFFNPWNIPDDAGLIESGPQPLIQLMRTGRFAFF